LLFEQLGVSRLRILIRAGNGLVGRYLRETNEGQQHSCDHQ
jgi:hypothetical protein